MPPLIYKLEPLQCSHKFTWAILFCKPTSAQISQAKYLKMLLWKNQSERKSDKMTKVMRD